jgi:hypothetical protein
MLAPICIALVTGQLSGVQVSFPSDQRIYQYFGTTLVTTTTTTNRTSSITTTLQTQTITTTSLTQSTTTFTFPTATTTSLVMTTVTTSVASSGPLSPPHCVIATAAYGSALAPEVVYMRYVRDQLISSTPPGRTLVAAFNTFYYSWSPAVAELIAGNGLLRAVFRVLLLPVVGITHVTALLFMAMTLMTGRADVASVLAFLAAAIMTIAVYVALPIVAVAKSKRITRELHARFRS